jgi:hypothetical protein
MWLALVYDGQTVYVDFECGITCHNIDNLVS